MSLKVLHINIKRKRCLILNNNTIKTVKIKKIVEECRDVKSMVFNLNEVFFNDYTPPKPGQFVMVWVPGVDEIPMSISNCDDQGNWSITIKNVGECTNAIHNLKIGDYIGVRGPLGNYYKIPEKKSKKTLLVGGGIGIAPLKFLSFELYKKQIPLVIVEGAKVKNELIFEKDFEKISQESAEIFYCTDDGSFGTKGFASETLESVLKDYSEKQIKNAIVYTCGPEEMMYKIFQTCEKYNIEMQASLERIMRCGCGLCGLCAIDPLGLLVCKDGPVFNSEQLRKMGDFGKYKRDFTGRKIVLD